MILVLFLYLADVFEMAKQAHNPMPPPLDSYEEEFPAGDPVHMNYGVSDFWWEAKTTKWQAWWKKMNVTIPDPYDAGIESESTLEATETVTQAETTSQNETAATETNTTVSQDETSLDISTTTEILLVSTTPAAEVPTKPDLPAPEIHDAGLLAQLRGQQGLREAPNYDYYGELHDEIPPNVRGPEYPGLSADIPVILNGTDKKAEKRLPAIPGWRLQFPDRAPNKDDGTPATEKTTFQINNADYFNVINDRKKVEPLSVELIGRSLQPARNGFQTLDLKYTVTSGLRPINYRGIQDKSAIPDSIEVLDTYSPVPFKFEEIATGREFMAQFAKAGPEGMVMSEHILNAVKAMSPSYTVPHEGPTEKPITTWFSTTEPTPTTGFTTEPTTTMGFFESITTISVTSTMIPPTMTLYHVGYYNDTDLKPVPQLDYVEPPLYDEYGNILSSVRSSLIPDTFTQELTTVPTTSPHPLVESLKKEMVNSQVGYYTVCLKKFFEIFSTKENKALKLLLRGGSNALQKLNQNNALAGLGRPMWPDTQLGFYYMRLANIELVKRRAQIIYRFYSSGTAFDVKKHHEMVDNLYYSKEGEKLMQAIAEFQDFPGVNKDMNADTVMEHLFRALLTPYFRDPKSPKVLETLKDINEKLIIASKIFSGSGDGRRNTQGIKNTSTKYNIKNKVANIEISNMRSVDDNNSDDIDDTTELPDNNIDGNETVQPKDGIDEKITFDDIMAIADRKKQSKKTEDYDKDSYVRMSKVRVIGRGIVDIKGISTKNKNIPKRKSKNEYGQNEERNRNDESKDSLLKDASIETHGQIGHRKETEMGLNVRHKVTEATILYHHDKYINEKPKKYTQSYNNAKKAFKSSKINHENGLLKDNKVKNTNHTNHARNGDTNDMKWYLQIIKYNKSKPKPYNETNNKIYYINSKDKITHTHTTAVPKRASTNKFGQHEVAYRNSESKVRLLKDENRKNKTRGQIGHHKEVRIGSSGKHNITGATKFYHRVKYGNEEPKKYPKAYKKGKKATKNNLKDDGNGFSKDIKVNTNYKYYARNGETTYKNLYLEITKYNKSDPTTKNNLKDDDNGFSIDFKVNNNYKYYARNGETTYKKLYLEITKYNKSDPKTNENKINYINSKNKINGKTKYASGSYEDRPIIQTKGIKTKNIRITKATSKTSDLSKKETFGYATYDYKSESNLGHEKENNININGKSKLSKNKDDDNDILDNSVDLKEIKYSKTTHRREEPSNKNEKRIAYRKSVKAKDYIKKLRIRRTTKEKEYFKDINQYFTTTISSHGETFQHKKIDRKYYFRTQNHKNWSSAEKVDPTQISKKNATENKVSRYGNKEILEDRSMLRAKNIKNNSFEDNDNGSENELKMNHRVTKMEPYDIPFNEKESSTVKNTKLPGYGNTKLSGRVLQKRFKKKQNSVAKNNEKHNNFSQSPKPPDLKQKDLGMKNKKDNIFKTSESNKNKSSHNENIKKFWPQSKSQYISNESTPYLKERFLDFNRDNRQITTTKNILRNADINKNILRDESSYSDYEDVLKSNLQVYLLHGGGNFTDTLHKNKKTNVIRDISSYSDEEDTLKKNIYKLFT